MKKTRLISLFLPVLFVSVAQGNQLTASVSPLSVTDEYQDASRTLALALGDAYIIDAEVTPSYSYDSYRVELESDDEHFNLSTYTESGLLLSSRHYRSELSSLAVGTAVIDTLNLSNEVSTLNVTDTDGNALSFSTYFAGPFADVIPNNINALFDVTDTEEGLSFAANDVGLGLLSNYFLLSFPTFNTYSWDQTSTTTYLNDLTIDTDDAGNPSSLSFNIVTADRFGGVYEHYDCTFESVSEIADLAPQASLMETASSEYTALASALSGLQSELNTGNFTEQISYGITSQRPQSYSNLYDFDPDGVLNDEDAGTHTDHRNMMLSDLPLIDPTQGRTFTGLNYGTIIFNDEDSTHLDAYYMIGISPDSQYSDILGADYWTELDAVVPQIASISPDYFTYDEASSTYTFDISAFSYADSNFGFDVLDALFGPGDYVSHIQPTYTADGETAVFDFDSLEIELGADNDVRLTLNYNSLAGSASATVSFDDFGTTDLESNPDLASCLEFWDSRLN